MSVCSNEGGVLLVAHGPGRSAKGGQRYHVGRQLVPSPIVGAHREGTAGQGVEFGAGCGAGPRHVDILLSVQRWDYTGCAQL